MRTHVETIPYSRLSRRFARFFVAWMEGDPAVRGFLPSGPFDPEALRAVAEARARGTFPRAAVAETLEVRHRALGSPPSVMASIEALRGADTYCVVAGQQPLLGGGPLFVALKALTVLALAREIEGLLRVRCVPLFWNHSDDHDVAEVDAAGVIDGAGRFRTLRAGLPAGRRPVRDLEDAARLDRLRADVAAALPETPHRAAVIHQLIAAADPRPAGWFTRLLTRWFGDAGLVVFEPGWLARESAPILARVLESPDLVAEALEAEGSALAAAGYPRPLADPGTGLFLHDGGNRCRVDRKEGRLVWEGGDGTPASVLARLSERPDAFSPGVALRPVVQDALFPSLTTVAGPNEASYLAQLGPLYRRLGGMQAPVAPRASATVVEPDVAAEVASFRVAYETVLRGESFAPPLPGALAEPFVSARRDLEAALARLGEATAALGPAAARNHEKTRERVLESIDIYARKVAEAADRSGGGSGQREEALRTRLTPDRRLQEQTLAGIWFLNRFGLDGFDRLGGTLDFKAKAHQVVIVES